MGVGLDRAGRDAERVGDLGLRQVEVVPQGQHLALSSGQASQRPQQGLTLRAVDRAVRVTTANYDYFYLCTELRRKRMIPIVTRIRAQSVDEFGDLVRHPGEEFVYATDDTRIAANDLLIVSGHAELLERFAARP